MVALRAVKKDAEMVVKKAVQMVALRVEKKDEIKVVLRVLMKDN